MIELAAIRFLQDVTIGDTSSVVRQNARARIVSRFGEHIYLGYRPEGNSNIQIRIARYSNSRWFDLPGEAPMRQSYVQFGIFVRGSGKLKDLIEAAEDLRLSLVDYHGDMDGIKVHTVTIMTDGMLDAPPPDDKSDERVTPYYTDFEFTHSQPIVNC